MTERVAEVVREILAVVPAGCSWLLPVTRSDGTVTDFRVGAASGARHDLFRRGPTRVDELLSELYPSIVGGRLWQLYCEVLRTGEPGAMSEFRYEENRAGVAAESLFDVSVHRVLGGLLVWWHRLDEDRRRLARTETLGNLGWAEYDIVSGDSAWSEGMYRIFEQDPADGPMTRAEQAAALLAEDRALSEAAWQTMDSGSPSDVTVRFRLGGQIKHLRVLSDVMTDAAGKPLKVYAVVQDVTARVTSRTALERLAERLHRRELTALAEHRLAAQLQNLIQPVPAEPFALPGLDVMVTYRPAESAIRVGGDWYHAQELPDGRVLLVVGDVAGHGLNAASGMAHLRFALIAWLSIGINDPATLLAHLNRLCASLAITGTAVIAVYTRSPDERSGGTLEWARAGHAPPLLARTGNAASLPVVRSAARAADLLLGADEGAVYGVRKLDLEVGDLLLLYTDGLVERRGAQPLVSEVCAALAAETAAPGGPSLARVAALTGPNPDDDTCTLAVLVKTP